MVFLLRRIPALKLHTVTAKLFLHIYTFLYIFYAQRLQLNSTNYLQNQLLEISIIFFPTASTGNSNFI